jgi:hypothetical protein
MSGSEYGAMRETLRLFRSYSSTRPSASSLPLLMQSPRSRSSYYQSFQGVHIVFSTCEVSNAKFRTSKEVKTHNLIRSKFWYAMKDRSVDVEGNEEREKVFYTLGRDEGEICSAAMLLFFYSYIRVERMRACVRSW